VKIDPAFPKADRDKIYSRATDRSCQPAHLTGLGLVKRVERIGPCWTGLFAHRPHLNDGSLALRHCKDVEFSFADPHVAGDHANTLPSKHLNGKILGIPTQLRGRELNNW
jgi:hypothetical protein